jgi:hypothetical protein
MGAERVAFAGTGARIKKVAMAAPKEIGEFPMLQMTVEVPVDGVSLEAVGEMMGLPLMVTFTSDQMDLFETAPAPEGKAEED